MGLESIARLLLIYAHLILCVFALHEVLVSDWNVLWRKIKPYTLDLTHQRLVWLLSGLWLTGLAVASIDLGFDPGQLSGKPKLVAKLVTVGVLSANGFLLYHWCFPRIERLQELGAVETSLVMAAGATSTASWLMAAFLGVAKSLQDARQIGLLELYGIVLAVAIVVSVAVGALLRRRLALPSSSG